MISFSTGFLREIAPSLLFLYVIALGFWVLGNFIERIEYVLKSLGWYWLALSLFSATYRMARLTEVITQPYMAIMAASSVVLFLFIIAYLWSRIGKRAATIELVAVLLFSLIMILGGWD